MSYRNLKIWQMARDLSIDIHKMTMNALPKHEMFEEGAQVRRSVKSVRSNIVEGYGRRRYKQDFIRFLAIAHSSCDETIAHLEILHETGSLKDKTLFRELHRRADELGRAIGGFVRAVETEHRSAREETVPYDAEYRPPDDF